MSLSGFPLETAQKLGDIIKPVDKPGDFVYKRHKKGLIIVK
jgi:hypothetical protein